MPEYTLGTVEASEALIRDLYIDLRKRVNRWSAITCQTPQARMGYIGQHLVSIVTGYPGGRSGARGYDLIISPTEHGEIKTCYRVDQLGKCSRCNGAVSSLESTCPSCGSSNIVRKHDSKWLITISDDAKFADILEPKYYYFVLFEFEDTVDTVNSDIIASIWEVDPKCKGFAFCMIDYYLNIRDNAPFNMWPHSLKFALTEPKLIYRSRISPTETITTEIFPTENNAYLDELKPLTHYSDATTVTIEHIKNIIREHCPGTRVSGLSKKRLLEVLEQFRRANGISNAELCSMFADEIYLPRITPMKDRIPEKLRSHFSELM